MEIEIDIPEPLVRPLLIQAAVQEISVEEIVERAIKHYIEGDKENA